MKKSRYLIELFLILFFLLFPHLSGTPMLFYPAIGFLLLWGYNRFSGKSFNDFVFSWSRCTLKSLITGGIIGVCYAGVVYFISGPLLQQLGLNGPDLHDFYGIRTNFFHYITLLVIAWAWVIPYEEIVFRGFILNTLQSWLGNYWVAGINNTGRRNGPLSY